MLPSASRSRAFDNPRLACTPRRGLLSWSLPLAYRMSTSSRSVSESPTTRPLAIWGASFTHVGGALRAGARTRRDVYESSCRSSRLIAGAVMGEPGLLDTLTDGGLGIALFWPFSDARYFAPWRPIPVAPIGRRLFAADGGRLMLHKCVLFLPLFIVGIWPRAKGRGHDRLRRAFKADEVLASDRVRLPDPDERVAPSRRACTHSVPPLHPGSLGRRIDGCVSAFMPGIPSRPGASAQAADAGGWRRNCLRCQEWSPRRRSGTWTSRNVSERACA